MIKSRCRAPGTGDGLRLVFGRDGDSFHTLAGGWSHDDLGITWTVGHDSALLLPSPRGRGAYRLRLTGDAFVAASVPVQRLFVRANGTDVGSFSLASGFAITCDLPWHVMNGFEHLRIEFRHPDAVRPCDVTDSDDRRWIAIGFREIRLDRGGVARARAIDPAGNSPLINASNEVTGSPFRPLGAAWYERPVLERFAGIVARHGVRAAVDDGSTALSFTELERMARQIAGHIVAATAPGEAVCIALQGSVWLPAAVLGCLGAGRPYLLAGPDDPEDALASAGARLAIVPTQSDCALPEQVPRLVLPPGRDGPRPAAIAGFPAVSEPVALVRSGGETAVWVAKSGRSLLHEIGQYAESCRFGDTDHHLALVPQSSVAARDILACVLTGGTLHVTPSVSPAAAMETLRRAPITVCNASLSNVLALTRMPGARRAFGHLRLMRTGNETVRWTDIAALRSVLPDRCRIFRGYESPETFTCMGHFVTTPAAGGSDIVPLGLMMPGFSASITDPHGASVADGGVGELVVESPFVADGTWRDGRLDRSAFLEHGPDGFVRRVRTGRFVRRRRDGLHDVADNSAPYQGCGDPEPPPTGMRMSVQRAWRAVLGTDSGPSGESFEDAGGDSLKLLEFAVELERQLGRRVQVSLLTLQMDVGQIATTLQPPDDAATVSALLPPHELMRRFESLGAYCEFGFAQRRCLIEPYGLLRFAGTTPEGLVASLERRFEGFADPTALDISVKPDGEYVVRDTHFGFTFHTEMMADRITREAMLIRESKRLRFLADRLLHDLSAAEKTFLYRSRGGAEDGMMTQLHDSLLQYGPNRLLWIVSADAEDAAGTIRPVAEGLCLGYVDPLAAADLEGILVDSWIKVCSAAFHALGRLR